METPLITYTASIALMPNGFFYFSQFSLRNAK